MEKKVININELNEILEKHFNKHVSISACAVGLQPGDTREFGEADTFLKDKNSIASRKRITEILTGDSFEMVMEVR